MVHGVHPFAKPHVPSYEGSEGKKPAAQSANAQASGQDEIGPAVKVDISAAARSHSLELKTAGADGALKPDEVFFSREARAQRKADFAAANAQAVNTDPFDNEFQILAVSAEFSEGTLEKFIADNLEGKAKNASLIAGELGQMIRGTISNPGGTVEERAMNRETALKHAEYLAQNHFDDPDETQAFLDGVKRFAENDVLREKGYVALDGSDLAPFKSYESSVGGEGVSWDAYAKEYGLSSAKDIFADEKTLASFYAALQEKNQQWSEDIAERFDEYEKKVTTILDNVKNSLDAADVERSLQRILKAF